MKVKTLIEQLKEYDPETELLVAYWDKDCVEGYGTDYRDEDETDMTLTDEQWLALVDKYDDGEWSFQSDAAELFVDLANDVLAETASPND